MHIYKELKIWQKSRNLVKEIYLLTEKFPKSEKYGLISQIQRASVSIPSNIAEGAGRGSDKDFIRFLEIAHSSSYELDTQIILANDLNYIKEEECQSISITLNEIQKMIYNLISKLKDKIDKSCFSEILNKMIFKHSISNLNTHYSILNTVEIY